MSYARNRMSGPAVRCLTVAAVLAAATAAADAHVAPSEDTNNRYVKLTPMADRVRIAYTILVGHAPGRVTRRSLDRDGDRTISEAEADTWARDLAARVLADLELTLDGTPVPIVWTEVVAGLDDRSVTGGAFALDLIAWPCLPGPAERHEIELVDRFSLTPAGETEVRIADEPGVRVEVARIGDGVHGDMLGRTAQFQKLASPLAEGLRVVYTATGATPLADGRCPGSAPKTTTATPRWPIVVGALLGAAVVVVLTLRRRKRA